MKLSHIVTGLLSVALLAFMVSDTLGQEQGRRGRGGQRGGGPGGGPGGGFGGFSRGGDPTIGLLRVDEVKTELQISSDQEEALTKMAEQGRGERSGGERPDFRNMSDEERTAFFAKMRKEQAERTKKMKEQLEEVLLPDQLDRLNEIALQVRGVQALADKEIAAKLKVTEDQQKKFAEVRDKLTQEMRDKMREIFSGGGGNREGIREELGKMRADMEKEVLGVLTTDQQKEFEEMKGEPFKMPEGAGRGGFGGERGGNRGNRGGGRPGGDGGGRRQRPPTDDN